VDTIRVGLERIQLVVRLHVLVVLLGDIKRPLHRVPVHLVPQATIVRVLDYLDIRVAPWASTLLLVLRRVLVVLLASINLQLLSRRV